MDATNHWKSVFYRDVNDSIKISKYRTKISKKKY